MRTETKIVVGSIAALGALFVGYKLFGKKDEEYLSGPEGVDGPSSAAGADILQTVGKHWIITNKIASNGKAANYGWHFHGAKFGGQPWEASVSLPGVRVIQGIGTRHDRFHADYSQTCILAADTCTYQGQTRMLADLLIDPEASKLLSVEGPMKIARQPGVPRLDPIVVDHASPGVTRADVAALPDDLKRREEILLSWTEQNFGEYAWADVVVGDLTFHVFSDALMFGGVRVSMTATLQQQIADRLSCTLLTARMADLVFQNAAKIIEPIPLQHNGGAEMFSTKFMLNENDKITDAALPG